MIFDSDQLHRDITKKKHKNKLSQNDVVKEVDVSRHTLWRLQTGKEITMTNFLKLLTWVGEDANRYIKEKL